MPYTWLLETFLVIMTEHCYGIHWEEAILLLMFYSAQVYFYKKRIIQSLTSTAAKAKKICLRLTNKLEIQ